MATLPLRYTAMIGISANNEVNNYIDTGLLPSSNIEVEMYLGGRLAPDSEMGYVFGSRNTNSNTSAGQFNIYVGKSNANSYIGYNNARISQNYGTINQLKRHNVSNVQNTFTLLSDNRYVSEFVGNTSSFVGTRNMYLFGLNNGGTYTRGGGFFLFGCKIKQNNTLMRNYTPVYDNVDNVSGIYDLVNETFVQYLDGREHERYELEIQTNGGGSGFVELEEIDNATKVFFHNTGNPYSDEAMNTNVTLKAVADEGYVFKEWVLNGEVISNEIEYKFLPPKQNVVVYANFVKKPVEQNNGCHAIIFKYGVAQGNRQDVLKNATYINVISAKVVIDLMDRAVTQIVAENIPSTAHINSPLFLYNSKNKIIYYGLVKSIEGNTVYCREPISVYDDDYLVSTSGYNAHYNTASGLYELLRYNQANDYVARKLRDVAPMLNDVDMSISPLGLSTQVMYQISKNTIVNLEDELLKAYRNYGIAFKYGMYKYDELLRFMSITPYNPLSNKKIYINDQIENIKNLQINVQEADATILEIYNSSGTTLRATFMMCSDGYIRLWQSGYSGPSYIANNLCKNKIVLSDENVNTLAKQYLNASIYQYDISFDLLFGKLIKFEDIEVGQPIVLYANNNIYESCITRVEYRIDNYDDNVKEIKLKLGNIRNTLTAKINLRKGG